MDHAKSYAFHIAQAIRHKKAMKTDAAIGEKLEIPVAEEEFEDGEAEVPAEPTDAKSVRRERIKAILSR